MSGPPTRLLLEVLRKAQRSVNDSRFRSLPASPCMSLVCVATIFPPSPHTSSPSHCHRHSVTDPLSLCHCDCVCLAVRPLRQKQTFFFSSNLSLLGNTHWIMSKMAQKSVGKYDVRAPPRRRQKGNDIDEQPVFLRKAYEMISTCPAEYGNPPS